VTTEALERWKAFDANPVSHSVAHHLMAIAALREVHGYARVTDVAERLGLTRGSVSLTLKSLEQRGLVAKDQRRFLELTGDGSALVEAICAKQTIVVRFLVDVLGVRQDIAETDACKIEHLLSDEAATAMLRQLRARELGGSTASPVGHSCAGRLDECPGCSERCLEALLTCGVGGQG
jgi:DtxR family Mn-dependent transcriptional regulator